MIYSICDFLVEYEPRYARLRDRSAKYIVEDQTQTADFAIQITDEDIDNHISKFPVDRELAEYVLAGIRFYESILDRGAFFLHSAALGVDGYGFAFTGPCGAGKSTHAGLWRRHFGDDVISINDDKPAVRIKDDKVYICGTPFSGKYDINTNVMMPLCGISILCQNPLNRIEKISVQEALPVLLEQTLRPRDPMRMLNLMTLMDEMLKRVPVYKLYCNITDEAVQLSYNTMKRE